MNVVTLPRRDVAPPDRPERPGVAASQARARALAEDPSSWSGRDVRAVAGEYETLAVHWDDERGAYRAAPLRDALERGGPWPAGRCVEVGAGTGLLTPLLARRWPTVAVDVSPAMLAQSSARFRVIADGAHLPLPDRSCAVVALADAPLFAAEVVRVLHPDGVVLCSNALGDAAPAYLPAEALIAALARRTPGRTWTAVRSEAEWGTWCVLRRT